MSTPHLEADPGDFAPTVLMPGDPLRARHIADRFLTDRRDVTTVRNMLGYTGRFRGERISVLGSGMGIPSLSVYAHELAASYGVRRLIRVGSCGAVQRNIRVRDIVVGLGACTDSGVNRIRFGGYDFAAIADYGLVRAYVEAAEQAGLPGRMLHVGNVFSSDLFYHPDPDLCLRLFRHGVLAVEMEAAGLYGLAAQLGIRALAVMTVSDHLLNGDELTSSEREQTLDQMIELALTVGISDAAPVQSVAGVG